MKPDPITKDQKIDAVFTFPDISSHKALAHVFEVEYVHYRFWYGVAHFEESFVDIPTGIQGGRCDLDDGRAGGITFHGGRVGEDRYFEVGFVGITALSKA